MKKNHMFTPAYIICMRKKEQSGFEDGSTYRAIIKKL